MLNVIIKILKIQALYALYLKRRLTKYLFLIKIKIKYFMISEKKKTLKKLETG